MTTKLESLLKKREKLILDLELLEYKIRQELEQHFLNEKGVDYGDTLTDGKGGRCIFLYVTFNRLDSVKEISNKKISATELLNQEIKLIARYENSDDAFYLENGWKKETQDDNVV